MNQLGFLDFDMRLHCIDKAGDPLTKINDIIDWEIFRPIIDQAREKERKSNAGAKGFDSILLFKTLILQSLYRLSDESLEFQIFDRYSFSRFLGLYAASKIPDCTSIWWFREDLPKPVSLRLCSPGLRPFSMIMDSGFKRGRLSTPALFECQSSVTTMRKIS